MQWLDVVLTKAPCFEFPWLPMILSHVPKRSPEANLYILKNSYNLCRHGHMLNL